MIVGWLLSITALGWLAGVLAGRRAPRVWLAAVVGGSLAALGAAVAVLAGGDAWEWRSEFAVGGERLHLLLDGVSAFFLALLCVIGGAGAVYGREYWSDGGHPESARSGRVWWSALL